MSKIALATCTQLPRLCNEEQALIPLLAAHGIDAEPVVWNESNVHWRGFDPVVIRSTWDYQEHIREFRLWLDHLESNRIRVLNPVTTLRQNLSKTYLKDLEHAGIDVMPTLWCDGGNIHLIRAGSYIGMEHD